jgi:pimeloyl-ACP methyl ester carboxylesterase
MDGDSGARLDIEGWTFEDGHTLVADGLRLHHLVGRRDTPSGGRTLLALHGMGSYGAAWCAVARHVSTVDTVVLPDLRGHAHSDWTTDGYWLRDYASDVEQVVTGLGLEDLDLAGHSLGARVSMVLAPRILDRLRTVTLSDTGPEVSRSGALKARAIATNAPTATSFRHEAAVAVALRDQHPDWVQEAVDLRARLLFRENWAGRWVPRGDPEVEHLLGRAGLAEVQDMWNGLAAITVPTLILRGMRSYLLDDALAQRMCDALAQPTLRELDLTHEMLYVRPDLVGAAIDEFLRGH